MPERAAETRQVPDDTREELIAKAASMWTQERAPDTMADLAIGRAAGASGGFGGVVPPD